MPLRSYENLREGLRKVRDNLRQAFAAEANDIATWVSDWHATINSVSGPLEEQLEEVSGRTGATTALGSRLTTPGRRLRQGR